jgi:hypothetical protein
MNSRVDNFIIREPGGSQAFANSLVLGAGLRLVETAGGLPELAGIGGEAWLAPSGGDDTARIRNALAGAGVQRVRLGPGTFTISDRITLLSGQVLAGSGSERTTLTSANYQFVEMLSGTTVESLTMDGVYIAGGPPHPSGAHFRVDGVTIKNAEFGIEGAGYWAVTNSIFQNIDNAAIGISTGSLEISGGIIVACGIGLRLSKMTTAAVSRVTMSQCAQGIIVNVSRGLSLESVYLGECGGVTLTNGRGAQLSGVQLVECSAGVRLEYSQGAVLAGCYVRSAAGAGPNGPLAIIGGNSIAVNGFHSDSTALGAGAPPHVLVAGGATQVMFTAVHVVNGTTPPTYEVDVSAAGGRVLFAQQNFDPARINSGGKFASL